MRAEVEERSFGPNTETGSTVATVVSAIRTPLSTRIRTVTRPLSASRMSSTSPTAMPRTFTSDLPGSRPCPALPNVAS